MGLVYRIFKNRKSKNKRNKAVSLNRENKLTLLFCYQSQTDPDPRKEPLCLPLPSIYQPCIFTSHSWLHVTLGLQPIYFTLGALRSAFQGPIKLCATKQMWNVIFTGTLLLFSASSSPPPQLLFPEFPPSFSILTHICVLHLFISDSETTEDETTEPQMETKEGLGRHQDKAGRRGIPGN